MEPKKTFRDLYKVLDQKTRNVIGFSDFDLFIADAVSTYSLNEDQLSKLVRLTVHIIVGIEKKEDFSSKISEFLKTPSDISGAMANDVIKKIINNIDGLYTKTLFLDGEELDEEEEVFIKTELCTEIRHYRNKINSQELLSVLRGNPFIPDIEHVVTFLKRSPQLIQKLVLSSGWIDKVKEIGLKYSLTEEIQKIFISEVLLVVMDLENKENLAENIERELGVSNVLAEQLTQEVNDRILKLNEKNTIIKQPESAVIQNVAPKVPYIQGEPPPNLPGLVVEEEPVVKTHPILQDQVKDFFAPPPMAQVESAPPPAIQLTPDVSQPKNTLRPIEIPLEEVMPPKPQSFIAQKLTQPTAPTQVTAPINIPKTYTSDPYREPLE